MSSATIAPLVRPTKGTKGSPPATTDTSATVQKAPSNAKVQLPVQVAPEVRRSFKAYAAERDMSMSDLFVHMWDDYRARNA
jgi:hypothetical protein